MYASWTAPLPDGKTSEEIALMAGEAGHAQENLNDYSLGGGQSRAETLYMEIRQGQSPVDPATFLRLSME